MSEKGGSNARSAWVVLPAITVATLVGGGLLLLSALGSRSTTPRGAPASRISPSDYGTRKEIGTAGNDGNPRSLFHGAYPSGVDTQELVVGGLPARFSGYTTWIRSVTRVPAPSLVDGYRGDYLRLRVTIFNRDTENQHVCACDFYVWTRAHGRREADAVGAPTVSVDTEMHSGARLEGDVYLYVGKVPAPYFVVYDPDAHLLSPTDRAKGVWRVPGNTATEGPHSKP